jgi:hypothetical protein
LRGDHVAGSRRVLREILRRENRRELTKREHLVDDQRRTRQQSRWIVSSRPLVTAESDVEVEHRATVRVGGIDVVLDAVRDVDVRTWAKGLAEDVRVTIEHPEVVVIDAMDMTPEPVSRQNREHAGHGAGVAPQHSVNDTLQVSERLQRETMDGLGGEHSRAIERRLGGNKVHQPTMIECEAGG